MGGNGSAGVRHRSGRSHQCLESLRFAAYNSMRPAPGTRATVSIAPDPVEVAPGHEHRARAEPRDGDGQVIRHGVTWSTQPARPGAADSMDGAGK